MSVVESALVRRLQEHVSFPPGSSHKRFIRDLTDESLLSEGGRHYLAYIAARYRRQYRATPEEIAWIVEWKSY
jgi:hypothetical protein